jgi:hypothetical protein
MTETLPGPRRHIDVTIAQHQEAARLTAAEIGFIAAQVEAGDFSVARAHEIAGALIPLTADLVAIGKAAECAARHPRCSEGEAA